MTLRIPHNAWVLVGDGEKALFLRNEGDAEYPNLVTMEVVRHENPATREQGSDRPGRFQDGPNIQRSSVDNTDWHRLEKERFAIELADHLYQSAHRQEFAHLVIALPPKTLGDLRHHLHEEVKSRIIAEVDKDLTHHPVHEIERVLVEKSG